MPLHCWAEAGLAVLRGGRVASSTLAKAMPKARVWMPVSVSPSTHTPTSAALTGSITVNTPPCAAGMDFSPVIHSHTVHTLAASA